MISDEIRSAMMAAVGNQVGVRIHARASWLRNVVDKAAVPYLPSSIEPGRLVARMGCQEGPCVELWAVEDSDASANWEVVS